MDLTNTTRRGMYQTVLNMRAELEMHCNTQYARIEAAQKQIEKSQELLTKLEEEFLKADLLVKTLKSKYNF